MANTETTKTTQVVTPMVERFNMVPHLALSDIDLKK